nr:hypothetical protein BCU43_19900 [Vibrio lentus]PMI89476.1 hypothetical protein BCU35_23040 [Vibrio lentus]PMI98573.1 hypothetical protein BCU32_16865 [Vibrio lentus]
MDSVWRPGLYLYNDTICHFANGDEANAKCKDGDVAMWTPNSFGNEQLPILYISLFCDFEAPITHTVGGVSCIFTTKRKAQWSDFGITVK